MEDNTNTSENQTEVSLLICQIGGKLCGIDVKRIQEVTSKLDITPVHHSSDEVLGIINLRGKIVTVLDCAKKLSLQLTKINDEQKIIIIDEKDESIGLLVDETTEVFNTPLHTLEQPPENIDSSIENFIEKVCFFKEHVIPILNINELIKPRYST